MLGEERFWKAVIEVELSPAMEDFLNYYGNNKLKQLKKWLTERSRSLYFDPPDVATRRRLVNS
jgi:hypothetical protein